MFYWTGPVKIMFYWTGPVERPSFGIGHVAVAVEHKVFSFEGHRHLNDEVDQIHVNVFNTVSFRWAKLPPVTPGRRGERNHEVPSSRYGYTAVPMDDIVYIWGGRSYCDMFYCNILYGFNVDTHSWVKPEVSGTAPGGREHHSACVLGKVMYIYGGSTRLTDKVTHSTNDVMYKLDAVTMVWTLINTRGTCPHPSARHSATIIGTKMFVFGRHSANGMRVFDTETDHWLSTPSAQPVPGCLYSRSAFAYNGELYVFGAGYGYANEGVNLWKFSPATFSWRKVEPKGKGCSRYRLSCCVVGDRVILFDYDLYILDLSPSLKTLCKLAVIEYLLDWSELPYNITWELATMSYRPPKTN